MGSLLEDSSVLAFQASREELASNLVSPGTSEGRWSWNESSNVVIEKFILYRLPNLYRRHVHDCRWKRIVLDVVDAFDNNSVSDLNCSASCFNSFQVRPTKKTEIICESKYERILADAFFLPDWIDDKNDNACLPEFRVMGGLRKSVNSNS